MKQNILTTIFICLSIITLQADDPDTLLCHVIAESGLVLRSGEGVHTDKLDLIPYEDTLRVIGPWMLIHDGNADTIDGISGHWLEAIYQGKKGYVFTGFVRMGSKYIPDSGSNSIYRLILEETTLIPLNYAPGLYWYGFYADEKSGTLIMKEIELNFEAVKREEGEHYQPQNIIFHNEIYMPKTNIEEKAKFIIGMKKPMITQEARSWYLHDKEHGEGKFLYPYESLQLHGTKTMYLKPVVKMTKDTSYNGDIKDLMSYTLTMANSNYNQGWNEYVEFTLPKIMPHKASADRHAVYKNPRIIWKGDLNEDGNEDIIIRTTHMSDSCGGSIDYHILTSEQVGEYFKYLKTGGGSLFYEGC